MTWSVEIQKKNVGFVWRPNFETPYIFIDPSQKLEIFSCNNCMVVVFKYMFTFLNQSYIIQSWSLKNWKFSFFPEIQVRIANIWQGIPLQIVHHWKEHIQVYKSVKYQSGIMFLSIFLKYLNKWCSASAVRVVCAI